MKNILILSASIAIMPMLLGMSLGRTAKAMPKQVEYQSCTTDLDCYCAQGYGEALNTEAVCVEYRLNGGAK